MTAFDDPQPLDLDLVMMHIYQGQADLKILMNWLACEAQPEFPEGLFLALTGAPLNAHDAHVVNLADWFVRSSDKLAIFAGLGLAAEGRDFAAAGWLVLGVFAGSLLWWLLLVGGVGLLRGRLTPAALGGINRVSGALVAGFGLWALASAVWG